MTAQVFILRTGNAREMAEAFREIFTLTSDGRLLWKKKISSKVVIGKEAGSPGGRGYRCVHVDHHRYMTHKIIFAIANGRYPSLEIDHIDRDKSNNRPENLRECTRAQNARNIAPYGRSRSSRRGVVWNKAGHKWQAQIKVDGKNIYLGLFDDVDAAACAYQNAARRFHGEFAMLEDVRQ